MGENAQLSFAPKNIEKISVDLGEVLPNRGKLGIEHKANFAQKTEEIRPEFL
jgi:hypothetical protein